MLRVGVLAVVASACGRIGFDTSPDGAVTRDSVHGHDEDDDGLADTDDFCPHVADTTNADTDGDRVGDACDPQPDIARQQWLYFSPMTGPIPWTENPPDAWTINADDWHYDDVSPQTQLLRAGRVEDVDVWVGIDVETLGTGGRQVALIINGAGGVYWYGELYDGGSGARLSITEFDGSGDYFARTTTPAGPEFPIGPVELQLSARPGASFTLRSGALMTTYATPSYTGNELVILAFGNHSGRVRYIAIIASQ